MARHVLKPRTMNRTPLPLLACAALLSCSSPDQAVQAKARDAGTATTRDGGPTPNARDGGTSTIRDAGEAPVPRDAGTVPAADGGVVDAGEAPGTHECGPNQGACLAYDEAIVCESTPAGRRWRNVTCGAGEGCYQGRCVVAQCSDECHLGESSGGRDCELYDLRDDRWVGVDDRNKLHDRARRYEKWIVDDSDVLLHEGIVYVDYANTSRSRVDSVYIGDTALHTGVYLAAEAFRLQSTGALRARKNVRKLVETFHLWFNVSGNPGNLATIAVPAGDRRIRDWTNWDCSRFDRYCNKEWNGRRWDYVGDPSRDMYVGPVMGLVEAYDALGEHDETYRELIREDLVVLAEELMRLRTIPMRLVLNGGELPVRNVDTRFFVPEIEDFIDGAVEVSISSSDLQDSGDIRGGQEFLPNPSVLFRQYRILRNIPDVPRASSAIMIAAFLRAAMHVTEGVPAYAARRQAIETFYTSNPDDWGNIDDWIELASRYAYTKECGDRYFGLNIAFLPMYLLAKLETDPARSARIQNEILQGRMWPIVENHKNVMFSYIYASTHPAAPASVAAEANDQIGQFRRPPLMERSIDLRSDPKYRNRESGCRDQVDHSTAVDVGDRATQYFMWHSHPWDLVFDGDPTRAYPGHDYLVGYWMGRAHNHLTDDTPNRCLRFR